MAGFRGEIEDRSGGQADVSEDAIQAGALCGDWIVDPKSFIVGPSRQSDAVVGQDTELNVRTSSRPQTRPYKEGERLFLALRKEPPTLVPANLPKTASSGIISRSGPRRRRLNRNKTN